MSFVFYDLETTGTHRHFDQVLQFAAIYTDDDLNELERVEMRCRLLPHIVPAPGALAVTRVTLEQLLDPSLPSHYEMMCKIVSLFERWSPAIFLGWNTLDFDEELLRQAFYQCLHPPYLTNTNGNGRTDLLRFCQALTMLRPGVLNVPLRADGKPSLKLDLLAPANGFPHGNAHDALADVEATIHICRIVQAKAPDLWSESLSFCPKAAAVAFMREQTAFLLTECYFGKPYRYALTMLDLDPANSGSVIAYDLAVDPNDLRSLSNAELQRRLRGRIKPVRRVKANKSPLLAAIRSVPSFYGLSVDALLARAESIKADSELCRRLVVVAEREDFEPSPHVEAQIYDGFWSNSDKSALMRFHTCNWSERSEIVCGLEDPRLRELGQRLIFNHASHVLCAEDRRLCERDHAKRLTASDTPWLTIEGASRDAAVMLADCSPEHTAILKPYHAYLMAEADRCRRLLTDQVTPEVAPALF